MMNILLHAAVLVALTAAVACDRSPNTDGDGQANAPVALADSDTIDEPAVPAATAGPEGESVEELPPTAGPLPLALSVAFASLGAVIVVRVVRRRVG